MAALGAAVVLASCGGDSEDRPAGDPARQVPAAGQRSTTTAPAEPPHALGTGSGTTTPPSGGAGGSTTTGPMDQPNPDSGGVPAPDPGPGRGEDSPAGPPDSPTHDTPPPPGSPPDRFEQFCSENPGAC